MRSLIIILLIFIVTGVTARAQQNVFKLSAQKQIISVHLNEDNSNKKITINSQEKIAHVQRFSIRGLAPELDYGWARTFHIATNETAEAIITIPEDKGVFNYGLRDMVDKLKPGTYHIYTIAVPKDAGKAAELKPKRILVATLVVA